jgi:sugar O-acyltransferase (sialic acid O-acetyltransferase NeuD family)
MIHDIAIYGAGGLGREMALLIHQLNEKEKRWNLIGFFDDDKSGEVDKLPVLGDKEALNLFSDTIAVLIGIADPVTKAELISEIQNPHIHFPPFFHPRCLPGSPTNSFGRGTVLTAGCILTTGITLGEFVVVNLQTTIGHDVQIGDYCSIMPSVNISGNVKIAEGVFIGAGATILQNLSVGAGAVIGAGAVVTHSILPGEKVRGVPAQKYS